MSVSAKLTAEAPVKFKVQVNSVALLPVVGVGPTTAIVGLELSIAKLAEGPAAGALFPAPSFAEFAATEICKLPLPVQSSIVTVNVGPEPDRAFVQAAVVPDKEISAAVKV
ncbi:hypothetical protein D3C87_1306920 [compost metagenome]